MVDEREDRKLMFEKIEDVLSKTETTNNERSFIISCVLGQLNIVKLLLADGTYTPSIELINYLRNFTVTTEVSEYLTKYLLKEKINEFNK